MKKIPLSAVLILAVLILNAAAQNPTIEQKMTPFAVGMSLSVLGEMYDENYQAALAQYQKNISYYADELKPVIELPKDAADYKRMDVALAAAQALRDKLSKSDKWQMLVGERFGTIYVQIKKNKANGAAINTADLRFSLELIEILANNPPSDIPADIVGKFKEFGKLRNTNNLASENNIGQIISEAVRILNTISSQ